METKDIKNEKSSAVAMKINKASKRVETLNGFQLFENGQRVYSPNNKPSASSISDLEKKTGVSFKRTYSFNQSSTHAGWAKIASIQAGSTGLRINANLASHCSSFNGHKIDLNINQRPTVFLGSIHQCKGDTPTGIIIYEILATGSSYPSYEVYAYIGKYTQGTIELSTLGIHSYVVSPDTLTYSSTKPVLPSNGTQKLDTTTLASGDYTFTAGSTSTQRVYNQSYKPTLNDLTGKAVDSDKLDGIDSGSFLRSDADDSFSGNLISTSRNAGIFGTYDSTKTDQIWSMGTAYTNNAAGTNFGNLYGLAYKHTNNTTGGTMAGGHQMVWCANGVPKAALGDGIWTSGTISENGQRVYSPNNKPTNVDLNLVSRAGDTMTGNLTITNSSPTVVLKDTDHKTAFLHANSNILYVLRSAGNAGTAWDNGPNGRHPMMLSLDTGDVTFSRTVQGYYTESNAYASQYSTKSPFYNDYTTTSTSAYFPALKQRGNTAGEDWATSIGQLVGGTGVVETSLQMIKSDGTSRIWSFTKDGYFKSHSNIYEAGQRVYSPNNKPTPSVLGAVDKSGDTMTGALKVETNPAIGGSVLEIVQSGNTSNTGGLLVRNSGTTNWGCVAEFRTGTTTTSATGGTTLDRPIIRFSSSNSLSPWGIGMGGTNGKSDDFTIRSGYGLSDGGIAGATGGWGTVALNITTAGDMSVRGSVTCQGIKANSDANHYIWSVATNWGMHWDTGSNQIQFMGAGVKKAEVDLDGGYIWATSHMTSSRMNAFGSGSSQGLTYNDKTAIGGVNDGWLRINPHSQFGSGIYCGTAGTLRHDGNMQTPILYLGPDTARCKLTQNSTNRELKITSLHGYLNIGSQNTSHCHYETDRPNHWFNKELRINGEIYCGDRYSKRVYHQGFKPTANDLNVMGRYQISSGSTDTIKAAGSYRLDPGVANNPSGDYSQLLHVNGAADTQFQIAAPYSSNRMYFRSFNNNEQATRKWCEVYTTDKKPTVGDIANAVSTAVLAALFPVGHLLLTTNGANPSTYGYPGSWSMIENDVSLHTTTSSSEVGKYHGSNTPSVPLPAHTHTGSTNNGGAHSHRIRDGDNNQGQGNSTDSTWRDAGRDITTTTDGNHSHSFTTNSAGTSNPTIDVRGRRYEIYAWRRSS